MTINSLGIQPDELGARRPSALGGSRDGAGDAPGESLAGRRVLITGAARGIGAAHRAAPARPRRAGRAGRARARRPRGASPPTAGARRGSRCDVADRDQVDRTVAAAVERLGGLDVVIAQRGRRRAAAARRRRPGDLRAHAGRQHPRRLLHAARRRRRTSPIPAATRWPSPRWPRRCTCRCSGAYSASKAAVEALGDTLRIELRSSGARVGVAYFAELDTDMTRRGFGTRAATRASAAPPAGRAAVGRASTRSSAAWPGVRGASSRPAGSAPLLPLRMVVQRGVDVAARRRLDAALAIAREEQAPLTTPQSPAGARPRRRSEPGDPPRGPSPSRRSSPPRRAAPAPPRPAPAARRHRRGRAAPRPAPARADGAHAGPRDADARAGAAAHRLRAAPRRALPGALPPARRRRRRRSWTRSGDAERLTAAKPLIVVMPDGGRGGWYTNWYRGGRAARRRWETYHVDQLLRLVDRRFRTVAARRGRAIAGLSMGGFGALSYAARHPDRFAAAASFSGGVDLEARVMGLAAGPLVVDATAAGDGGRPGLGLRRLHDPGHPLARAQPARPGRQPARASALTLRTGDGRPGGPFGGAAPRPHRDRRARHERQRARSAAPARDPPRVGRLRRRAPTRGRTGRATCGRPCRACCGASRTRSRRPGA